VEAAKCNSQCSGGSFVRAKVEAEGAPMCLSMVARVNGGRRCGETATRPSETGENGLGQCAILRSFLEGKERSGDSSKAVDYDWRAAVVLFTTGREKLKCGRLTTTPAMRLGREAPGS
jgi:hypothetical protein